MQVLHTILSLFTAENMVRAAQSYVLLVAICVLIFTVVVGPKINKLRFDGAHVYYAYALILLLGMVQIKQCLEILSSPINFDTWWYILVCKHISLFVYCTIIDCIRLCRHCQQQGGNDAGAH